jgi:Dyp-type peroxidase family
VTFSNHIGSSSELLVLADIKPGFVPIRSPISYANRLRRHLKLLDALRRNGLEADTTGAYVGPIDSLRTLQFISWTLTDNDTKMLLAVNFDRAFEPYIRRIVDQSGPLLDTIFCHCVGFEGRSSDQGFAKFMDFVTDNQAPVDLFAAAAPDLTVDDGDYFVEVNSRLSSNKTDNEDPLIWLAEQTFTRPHEKQLAAALQRPHELLNQAFRILRVFNEVAPLFPKSVGASGEIRDDILFYNLANKVMPGFWRLIIARLHKLGNVSPENLARLQAHLGARELDELRAEIERLTDADKDPLLARLLHTYRESLYWFSHPPQARADTTPPRVTTPGQVQRGLISRPGAVTHAGLLFLRVDDAAAGRQFLTDMEQRLWPGDDADVRHNLSITHAGLGSLGMHEDKRSMFPRAFREGMEGRAGLLGDTGVNHPTKWSWPKVAWPLSEAPRAIPPWTIDIIIQITVKTDHVEGDHVFSDTHPVYAEVLSLASSLPKGVRLLGVDPMWRKYMKTSDNKNRIVGHLGFADAISQPEQHREQSEYTTAPSETYPKGRPSKAQLGDLLIGHKCSLDTNSFTPAEVPLQDGTFQVIRKLRIDVQGFDNVVADASVRSDAPDENWRDRVAAKMIGREKDGTPLTKSATGLQDFNFTDDPHGHQIPLQSHVRLSNPREYDTPRILRRGFSYGPSHTSETNDADRGLYFIAYAASLSEQFEVLQRWMSGSNSSGLSSWHGDPLLSPKRPGAERHFRYVEKTEKGKQLVVVDLGEDPIARLQWGIYAFTPSLEGLRYIASEAATQPDPVTELAEPTTISRILSLDKEASVESWRMLLEDSDDDRRAERKKVWAEIREQGGVMRTNYAVLVASAEAVDEVLRNDDGAFSTREYLERMETSLGPQYLGFDRTADSIAAGQDHKRESDVIGSYLNDKVDGSSAFDFAFAETNRLLQQLPEEFEPNAYAAGVEQSTGRHLSLIRLIMDLVAQVCHSRFGLDPNVGGIQPGGPEPTPIPHCPGDFLSASAHIFTPYPDDTVSRIGQFSGQRMRAAAANIVAKKESAEAGTLLAYLHDIAKQDKDNYWTDDKLVENLTAVSLGLAAPVYGSFLSVMVDWIEKKTLWRNQQVLQEQEAPVDLQQFAFKHLLPQMFDSMTARTAPDLIMRRTTKAVQLAGVALEENELIVGSLASALDDDPQRRDYFMFGGNYHERKHSQSFSHHACPGRSIGTNTILGCIMAILSSGELEPVGPLTLRVRG